MSENTIDWAQIHVALSAPFARGEVKKKPGRGGSGAFEYIDARTAMDRLDEAVGPGSWQTAFTIVDESTKAVECRLTIHGLTRADVGYPNSPGDADKAITEPLKAAYSDSFKRAAVHWGIGRLLYRDDVSSTVAHDDPSPQATRSGNGATTTPANLAYNPKTETWAQPDVGPLYETPAEVKQGEEEDPSLYGQLTRLRVKLATVSGTSDKDNMKRAFSDLGMKVVPWSNLAPADYQRLITWARNELEAAKALAEKEATEPVALEI